MKRKVFIFITVLLQYFIVCSQSGASRIIQERMGSKNIPGMAFMIAKDGEVLEEGYFGKANLELNVDVTKKSVFAIASMSKTYTATAILLMAEKGLLDLDDSIKKYIPEAPENWEEITIKHLLTHSSGLVDDWALYNWNKSNQLFLETSSDSLFLKHMFDKELLFKPGTSHSYSCGTFVLGVIIERITGNHYGQFLKEHIFEPLKLSRTFVDHPYKIIPNRVSGYFRYDPKKMNTPVSGLGNGIRIAPAAYGRADVGIRTSAKELMVFYNGLLSNKLINEQSKKMMFEPSTLENGDFISTGAGWMNWPLGGIVISEHSGGFRTGFSSQAFLVPKDKFIVILLSNLHGGVNFPLAQEIASLYYPEFVPLSKRPPTKDTGEEMTKTHLDFFQGMPSGQINEYINEAFPSSYYSKKLKKSISKTEAIEFLGERNVLKKGIILFNVRIRTLRFYKLNKEKPLYTTVYLDKSNKLVFIDYPEAQ